MVGPQHPQRPPPDRRGGARIIERGLSVEGRLCRLVMPASDRPGSLVKLLSVIAAEGGSIKEVQHDRSFGPVDVAQVKIACLVETRDRAHIVALHSALTAAGYDARIDGG